MKRGALAKLTLVCGALGSFGCQTDPYCAPLSECGGQVVVPGAPITQWVTTKNDSCLDQIQPPPNPVSLVRQPQRPAGDRPTERGTADWCSNVALRQDGTLQQYLGWYPPIPVQDATLDLLSDGNYEMHITYFAKQHVDFSATCLSAQGVSESCAAFGRNLKEFVAPEANIYNVLCYPAESGCGCDYDLSLIGGPSGQWSVDEAHATLTFFDALGGPPALATYCQKGDTLEITGKDGSRLFNQFGLRTMRFTRPTCHDGVQSKSIGEVGIDCGGQCNPELPEGMGPPGCPASCEDGVQSGLEEGVDCGGTCPEVCACHNGQHDAWEEGLDCGGPCKNPCSCFDGIKNEGEDEVDCGGRCSKPCLQPVNAMGAPL
ncbi:MAG TPA: hypothetical protein VHB79_36435 [Polyangiaceae bacterium]|nr:hypothetical protein [Polyangiaceae bacterium]